MEDDLEIEEVPTVETELTAIKGFLERIAIALEKIAKQK